MAAEHGPVQRAIERRLLRSPRAIRLVARFGAAAERVGIPFASLDVETLLAEARRRTGLDDFGDDWFREPLGILLATYATTEGRNVLGRMALRGDVIRLLVNRLLVQRDLAQHPEILRGAIRRPIFIVGFPRSGTTLLHNLLALGRGARFPRVWELLRPSGPPRRAGGDADPRIRAAEDDVRVFGVLLPGLSAMHHVDAHTPEECIGLLQHTFATPYFTFAADGSPYWDWLVRADLAPAYRYHRVLLQLLQWQCPGDYWVLKSPTHLLALDALLAVYPDARIVHLHRDLEEVVASNCSLHASFGRLYRRDLDPRQLGERWLFTWRTILDRALAARAGAPAATVLDLPYRTLVADPIGTVHRVHAHFGITPHPETDARMRAWLARNPQGKYGVHRYSLREYGLCAEQVHEWFADYRTRFAAELA